MVSDVFEFISIALTVPTIGLSLLVVVYWWSPAVEALATPRKQRDATQWFIIGVAVGFAGSVVDNLYWGAAWTAYYLESDWKETLFANGVYFNLFDRQLAGIGAAYCHVRAALKNGQAENQTKLNRFAICSGVFGFVYTITLSMIRGASFGDLFGWSQ